MRAVNNPTNTKCTGLGFVFTQNDPYIGIDCDGCLEGDNLNPFVQELVKYCDSYTEKSISGTGIHIIIKGKLPDGYRNKRSMSHQGFKALEVYDHGRYFTMTGEALNEIKPVREVDLSNFQFGVESNTTASKKSYVKRESFDMTNIDWYVKKITDSQSGQKFAGYNYRGDLTPVDGDQSRGDFEFVKIIANEVGFQPKVIDSVFRASAMMRPK